ncbi:hypothetical protein vBVpaS1601_88 [Vibrio phage vB_VpaS_1601]|uniref:hypothetical protein n=1 Tax=Vibrio phage SHOU24 TaxID=1414739 RepID=UPI0003ED1B20|nr:hypothetical protein SHOU24_86 [Vibrio phage SHOU24]AHI61283.1 hypothetical protein SHOU24_86 [Vibrio phage SHOU24]WHM52781.1 hypothetical protein vBVpaP1601_88 [Vibrio phage vB_VpaP_1601]
MFEMRKYIFGFGVRFDFGEVAVQAKSASLITTKVHFPADTCFAKKHFCISSKWFNVLKMAYIFFFFLLEKIYIYIYAISRLLNHTALAATTSHQTVTQITPVTFQNFAM